MSEGDAVKQGQSSSKEVLDASRLDQSAMLGEDQQHRIRLEEVFRSEVRTQVEAHTRQRSHRARVVAFLNTGFGLWLLSTLAVGGIFHRKMWLRVHCVHKMAALLRGSEDRCKHFHRFVWKNSGLLHRCNKHAIR
jgi:hypothetical protein